MPAREVTGLGDAEAIVALAVAAFIIMVGLAVVEFIHDSKSIALTDGRNALYATKS